MNNKRSIAAVLALAAVFGGFGGYNGTGIMKGSAAEESGWEYKEPETLTEGDYTYVQNDRFWYVQKYNGSEKDVVIPAKVNGVTVRGIEPQAFSGNNTIESVEIPEGIDDVNGFSGCTSLKKIKFHDYDTEKHMTISENAFKDCISLESAELPNGTYYIENDAFAGCKALSTVTFPKHDVNFGKLAFKGTPWLDSLPMDKTGCRVFRGTVLSGTGFSAVMPKNAERIGNAAFRGQNGLHEVLIPANVKEIEPEAFVGCSSLTRVIIANPDCRIKSGIFVSDSVPYIDEERDIISYSYTFSGTICGYKGSSAETYAKKHDIKFEELNAQGDTNGDGKVDSVDASSILSKYAKNMTGEGAAISDIIDYAVDDVNGDGVIDPADASSILSYYAYTASGGDDSIGTFLAK
ncbi:MAG: leucine-rich repeat protein [Ruminococcus sp.]|uniref:leucine-rich repeat protein n=1 Tax=Ruminococcus sp. TaxID=41978 RepID=UPI0025E356F2|nr:leucine-rich repeat protein [Ruminococcus sp.]MBR6996590.1 leucine-rich repeat protein [Ruminococcus sp.]